MASHPNTLRLLAVGVGLILGLYFTLPVRHYRPAALAESGELHQIDGKTLDRQVRSALPLGSSLATVEEYLKKRGLDFEFDMHSKMISAIARRLRGGTWPVSVSLTFQFHFDDQLILKSIESKEVYTGP